MTKSYQLKRTDKNFPSLSPAPTPKSLGPTGKQNQAQPVMSTKLKADAGALGLFSPDALPPDSLGSSSVSTSSTNPATPSTLPVVVPVSAQSEKNSTAVGEVEAVMTNINGFRLNPSFRNLLTISQSLKDLRESIDFKVLTSESQYQPTLAALAKQIMVFWGDAQSSIEQFVKNEKITLQNIAKISYSLQACIQLDEDNRLFKADDWKVLRPAICKLMRSLINCINKNDLLAVDGRNNVGNVLALLGWISRGIMYQVPDFGKDASAEGSSKQVGLLRGFKRTEDNPSLIDIAQSAVNYLLNSPLKMFDTRQLGKMVMQLGRMITAGDLGIQESDDKPWIEPSKLAEKLVTFSKSSLMTQYQEKNHAQDPDYVNPIAVDNLCEGLLTLFKKQVLVWTNKDHINMAVNIANLISKAMASGRKVDNKNWERYNEFLEEAIENLPPELTGPFNEAMNKLNN
jgi:hypothetical protein